MPTSDAGLCTIRDDGSDAGSATLRTARSRGAQGGQPSRSGRSGMQQLLQVLVQPGGGHDDQLRAGRALAQTSDQGTGLAGEQAARRQVPRTQAALVVARRAGRSPPRPGRGPRCRSAGCRAPAAAPERRPGRRTAVARRRSRSRSPPAPGPARPRSSPPAGCPPGRRRHPGSPSRSLRRSGWCTQPARTSWPAGSSGSPVTTATLIAYAGMPVQVVDRAVDRVDDPGQAAGPADQAALLAQDAVVRPGALDLPAQQGLGGGVHRGDDVGRARTWWRPRRPGRGARRAPGHRPHGRAARPARPARRAAPRRPASRGRSSDRGGERRRHPVGTARRRTLGPRVRAAPRAAHRRPRTQRADRAAAARAARLGRSRPAPRAGRRARGRRPGWSRRSPRGRTSRPSPAAVSVASVSRSCTTSMWSETKPTGDQDDRVALRRPPGRAGGR